MTTTNFMAECNDIRRVLKRYKRDSVISCCLQELQKPYGGQLLMLKQHPWLVALIVKWICIDGVMLRRDKADIPLAVFNTVRQRLWNLSDHLADEGEGRIMMRRITHAQIKFQQDIGSSFLIEPILIKRLPPNHRLRRYFKEKTGLEESSFIDLALFFQTVIRSGNLSLNIDIFKDAPAYISTAVDAFIKFLSRDITGLVKYVRSLNGWDRRVISELVEFPVFARYPFLNENGMIHCWHPMIYHHGVSESIHSVLAEIGDVYTELFSKIFEAHVIELARSSGGIWWSDSELKKRLPAQSEVTEGLLAFDGCNVLIESKVGLFPQDSVTAGRRDIVRNKTRAIDKAVRQGGATSTGIRMQCHETPDPSAAAEDFLVIVTNRELGIGTGEHLYEIYPDSALTLSPGTRLLLENIFVMAIEDYEWMMEAARRKLIFLPEFLSECRARNANPATAMRDMSQHLEASNISMRLVSPGIELELSESYDRIKAVVGENKTENTGQ